MQSEKSMLVSFVPLSVPSEPVDEPMLSRAVQPSKCIAVIAAPWTDLWLMVLSEDGKYTSQFPSALLLSEEQFAFISQGIATEIVFTDEEGTIIEEEEAPEGISMDEYFVLLGGIVVCTMLISISGGTIANSVVTEKSTRVVEYLMINVRPMALIVGKILFSLLLTVIQFAVVGECLLLSNVLQGLVLGAENVKPLSETLSFLSVFVEVNPVNIVLAFARRSFCL